MIKTLSFEFFPPRSPNLEAALWTTLERLTPLQPAFVSVTYGAGGSTRDRTVRVVERIAHETPLVPAAHLTCVGATRDEIDGLARRFWDQGIRHIVALRGDPPAEMEHYEPHPHGYENAAALVAGLRRIADFEVSVAAYPEVHPDSPSEQADLDNLKRKIDAGATRAITQFFFEAETFLRFRDKARAAGIHAPLIPGILPITNFARAVEFSRRCGATVPRWMFELFAPVEDDPAARRQVAAEAAAELCRRLTRQGVDGVHVYTLNQAEPTWTACRLLGMRPLTAAA